MGRKPKYRTVKEMQKKIDAYFEDCEGLLVTDPQTGKVQLDKMGNPVYIDRRPPTITGLALALGFSTRMGLLRYQDKPQFQECVETAKSRVEKYVEERLFDKDGANGAKFSLQFNFKGWQEEKSDESKVQPITIINDIPQVLPPENTEVAQFNALSNPSIAVSGGQAESGDVIHGS